MKKFIPFFILIVLIFLIGLATYNINKKQDNLQTGSSANSDEFSPHFIARKILLPEFSLPDLFDENKNFSKKDLIGKYSVVNFFASWCTTCRAEHEVLMRLKDEGIVEIYGVAWRDIDESTKKYLKENGNPFKSVAKDSRGLFTQIAGINAIPETFIIDPKGDVVMSYKRNLQEFAVEEIANFINSNKR